MAPFAAWLAERERRAKSAEDDAQLPGIEGLVVHCTLDEGQGTHVENLAQRDQPGQIHGRPVWVAGRVDGGVQLAADDYVDLGDVGDFPSNRAFSYGMWLQIPAGAKGTILAKTETSDGVRGYRLSVQDGRLSVLISSGGPDHVIQVTTTAQELPADHWHHVFVTYDGSRLARGVTVYVDGKARAVDVQSDSLNQRWRHRHVEAAAW